MSEQEENELIAEKLLAWKRGKATGYWYLAEGPEHGQFFCRETPTFTDWATAGLIAEAFARLGIEVDLQYVLEDTRWEACTGDLSIDDSGPTGPLALRAMALAYLRSAT